MNVQATILRREPVRLTVEAFIALHRAGTFAAFAKSELLDGELSGVPRQGEDEPESDRSVPIKLGVQDYELLDGIGALAGHDRTELIDGLVYTMSPQYRPHGYIKDELAYRLRRALEVIYASLHVATEQSVAIVPYHEPQPDIIVTSQPRGMGAIPIESVSLLVEVSDTTLAFDLNEKASIYATAGVSEYWVADVNGRVIHQMSVPSGDGYTRHDQIAFGDPISASAVEGLRIGTTDL